VLELDDILELELDREVWSDEVGVVANDWDDVVDVVLFDDQVFEPVEAFMPGVILELVGILELDNRNVELWEDEFSVLVGDGVNMLEAAMLNDNTLELVLVLAPDTLDTLVVLELDEPEIR
jgi:hypothetical protein